MTDTNDAALRVLICGSRTYQDAFPIRAVLQQYALIGPTVVIHGAARGADSLADKWATDNGVPVLPFAANWTRFGKRAGFIRNSEMLSEGRPDVVWAFVDKPLAESKGTAMMVDIARKGGVPCYVVEQIDPPTPTKDNV